jgi:CheY-like chemotaxis protein
VNSSRRYHLDNPIARKLLKTQLERVKLQVEATTNGEEAIAAWEKHGPGYFQAAMFDHRMFYRSRSFLVQGSLGFLDMPVCDGVEAARRIRALEVERRYDARLPSKLVACEVGAALILISLILQVIALSADCQESTKQLCLNSGMDAFLSKPANKTTLFNMLQKLAPPVPMDMDIPPGMPTSP